jgi:hypothetical protein
MALPHGNAPRDRRRPLHDPDLPCLKLATDEVPLAGFADPDGTPAGSEPVADAAELRVRDRRPQGTLALQRAALAEHWTTMPAVPLNDYRRILSAIRPACA